MTTERTPSAAKATPSPEEVLVALYKLNRAHLKRTETRRVHRFISTKLMRMKTEELNVAVINNITKIAQDLGYRRLKLVLGALRKKNVELMKEDPQRYFDNQARLRELTYQHLKGRDLRNAVRVEGL